MPRDIRIKRRKPRRVRIPVNAQARRSEAEHLLELDRFISQVEHRIEANKIGSIPSSNSSYATTSTISSSRSEGTYAQFCSPISDDSRSSRRRKVSYKTKFTEHLNFSDSDFDAVLFEAAVNDCYPAEKRKLTIKLRVNGEPPSKPKRLCLVGEIPKGCEDIVEGLREDPENTYLLAELRKRGFKAVADPLKPVRHRCWCPTCDGGWNKGAGCCAVTVVARFGDGGTIVTSGPSQSTSRCGDIEVTPLGAVVVERSSFLSGYGTQMSSRSFTALIIGVSEALS